MAKEVDGAIREHLAPVLRNDGFVGSGRNFRRLFGPIIHVVNVQGSMYSKMFAVNLGLHLSFLPGPIGRPVDPKKIVESECEFRRRLTTGTADHWWPRGDDTWSIEKAVNDASAIYMEHGRALFSEVGKYPESFDLHPQDLLDETPRLGGFGATLVRMALAFARIRYYQGSFAEAREFAGRGLAHLGGATGLRRELEQLLDRPS